MGGYRCTPITAAMNMFIARQKLPIYEKEGEIREKLSMFKVTVIEGETGSGKSTHIPQWALEILEIKGDNRKVIVTQPRRIAAKMVAKSVAEGRGQELGREIGYTVRFDNKSTKDTIINYVTDGILLKIIAADPALSAYGFVFIDEAHERSLATDTLLFILKGLLKTGKSSLHVVIMSATIDADRFRTYFADDIMDDVPIVKSIGRQHHLEIKYMNRGDPDNLVDNCVKTCLMIHAKNEPGDVLVFATGAKEIHEICDKIEDMVMVNQQQLGPIACYPLYSEMPPEMQSDIHKPAPPSNRGFYGRKIIVSTNYGESSITIPRVKFVVDGGKVKTKDCDFHHGMNSLLVKSCTQASANQRAGRAGRTEAGIVYRLYAQNHYESWMAETLEPAIIRSDITGTLLMLRNMDIKIPLSHELMDTPSPIALIRAQEELLHLGAIDEDGALTMKGKMMAEFPQDPKWSSMLVHASELGCVEEIMIISAMYSVSPVFYRPSFAQDDSDMAKSKREHPYGDLFTLLNVYKAYMNESERGIWCIHNFLNARSLEHARNEISQMQRICSRIGLASKSQLAVGPAVNRPYYYENIVKVILTANIFKIAYRRPDEVKYSVLASPVNEVVRVHPGSAYARGSDEEAPDIPEWVCYEELNIEGSNYLRGLTMITPELIRDSASDYFKKFVIKQEGVAAEALKHVLSL